MLSAFTTPGALALLKRIYEDLPVLLCRKLVDHHFNADILAQLVLVPIAVASIVTVVLSVW